MVKRPPLWFESWIPWIFLVPKTHLGYVTPSTSERPSSWWRTSPWREEVCGTVRWKFPKIFRCFWCLLKTKLLLQVPKVKFEQKEMKSKLNFLNACLLTKRLQVGKSNIPNHASIWFCLLFPTWRVVPNTYLGWGLGEVKYIRLRRTSGKEKLLLQSPKRLLVKLLIPRLNFSTKKEHF